MRSSSLLSLLALVASVPLHGCLCYSLTEPEKPRGYVVIGAIEVGASAALGVAGMYPGRGDTPAPFATTSLEALGGIILSDLLFYGVVKLMDSPSWNEK